MILNSPYVSGSLTVTGNITALGGISISGSIASASYASNAELLDGLDSSVFVLSSSFQNYTSSNDGKVAALNTFSASILSYTSSTDDKIAQLNRETASLNLATASLNNATASLYNTTASLNAAVADIRNATASLYAATSSIYNFTSSANLRIGSLEQYTQSLNTRSASFACVTATNTFACAQYFSNASNAISFTSTGSLYSDGGMRLTKDLYVSGTSYFNNVTVFGTQSINYITSSQLNIASNLITVNTATPSVRFGGLAVYDSGSLGTGLTGSILWDSEANHWVYSNPSGSTYSGGMFISGPRSAALGSEQGTTACRVLVGQGGDHLTSSAIYHDTTVTCIPTAIVGGSTACFANDTTIGRNLYVGNTSTTSSITLTGTSVGGFTAGYIYWGNGNQVTPGLHFNSPGTNVEITTGFNERVALSTGIGLEVFTNNGSGTYTSRMLLNRSGNLGLGISPTTAFTISRTSVSGLDADMPAISISNACSSQGNGSTSFNQSSLILSSGNGTVSSILRSAYDSAGSYGTGVDLFVTTNHYLRFGTSNTERVRITSTGIACFACQVCVGGSVTVGSDVNLSNDKGIFIKRADGTLGQAFFLGSSNELNVGFGVADVIRFATYLNTERLRITNTGIACFACQVCAPTFVLANGNCITALRSTGGAAIGVLGFTSGTDTLFIKGGTSGGSAAIQFQDTGGTIATFYNNSLGIGTATPCSTLHVVPTASNSVIWPVIINNQANCPTTGYGVGLRLQNSTISGAQETHKWAGIAAIAGGSAGYSNDTDLAFYVGCFIAAANCTCPPVEKMRIQSSTGYVGIGNSNPSSRLHIGAALENSGDAPNALTIKQTSTNETTGIYLERSGERKGYYIYVGGSVDSLNFQRNNAGTKSDTMTLTRDGKVGIGNTNPIFGVEICSNGSSENTLRIRNSSATGAARIILNPEGAGAGSTGDGIIFFDMNSTAWVMGVDKSDSSKFKIANDVYGDFTGCNYLTINTNGVACFACTVCSGGSIARKGFDSHTGGQWYKVPFYVEKTTGSGTARTVCLISIDNNDSFQEMHFTIEYGSRLQGVSDSNTQTSLRTYGVNRFVGGTATVNDVYLITGGSGCNINTHAPMSVAIDGACRTVVKVDFSSSLGSSSFVWGEVRIWSIESLTGKITISGNNY